MLSVIANTGSRVETVLCINRWPRRTDSGVMYAEMPVERER